MIHREDFDSTLIGQGATEWDMFHWSLSDVWCSVFLTWYSLVTVMVLSQIKHMGFGHTLLNIYFTVHPLSNCRISLPAVTDSWHVHREGGSYGRDKTDKKVSYWQKLNWLTFLRWKAFPRDNWLWLLFSLEVIWRLDLNKGTLCVALWGASWIGLDSKEYVKLLCSFLGDGIQNDSSLVLYFTSI